MYISKIELENIRCFKHLTIDLKKDRDIILWTTILGDNAVGKSTILKCIAMGLCDEASAAALMKETTGEFLRKKEKEGYIKLTLEEIKGKRKFEIITNIKKEDPESPEKIRQGENKIPWQDIFFCGYGVEIGNNGTTSFKQYEPLEAVYTLFNSNGELQNPELIMLRQTESVRKILEEKLLKILMQEKDYKISYSKKGMVFNGPSGEFLIGELSDGYRTISLRITDFFGWASYAEKFVNKEGNIEGILLIDELENHLHAKWQRYIVSRLRKQLSGVQIIITTHSPIIALGTSDLAEKAQFVELEFESKKDNLVKENIVNAENYKGLSVDQILTTNAFNLPIARSGITGDKLIAFRTLFLKDKRTKDEDKKFKKLKIEIEKDIPEAGEKEMDRVIQKDLKDILENLNKKLPPLNYDKTKT
ncbi:MAG: AAA family ATPase [FCB group bacterium]|jgi:predicted ATP-binding protein involved in virulence